MEAPKKLRTPTLGKRTDDEVIRLVQSGSDSDMEIIIDRYKPLVLARARSYFLVGGDRDDLVQEGMIGLFKAVRDYNIERGIPFQIFAEMCVVRQLQTAVKAANRQKHKPLNSYVSLSRRAFDEDSDKMLIELHEDEVGANPEKLVLKQEEDLSMSLAVETLLSEFEQRVLQLYLAGIAYSDMGKQLDKSAKAIDNALQRIRKKIEKHVKIAYEKGLEK